VKLLEGINASSSSSLQTSSSPELTKTTEGKSELLVNNNASPNSSKSIEGKSQHLVSSNDSPNSSKSTSPTPKGRTTVLLNKSPSPVPSVPSPSVSPLPRSRNERKEEIMNDDEARSSPTPSESDDKLSAEQVRQLCRPRVKLTNFTIGSYKKDIDIFAET